MRSLFLTVVRRFVSSPAGPVLWATRPSTGTDGEPIRVPASKEQPNPDDMHKLMLEHSDAVTFGDGRQNGLGVRARRRHVGEEQSAPGEHRLKPSADVGWP